MATEQTQLNTALDVLMKYNLFIPMKILIENHDAVFVRNPFIAYLSAVEQFVDSMRLTDSSVTEPVQNNYQILEFLLDSYEVEQPEMRISVFCSFLSRHFKHFHKHIGLLIERGLVIDHNIPILEQIINNKNTDALKFLLSNNFKFELNEIEPIIRKHTPISTFPIGFVACLFEFSKYDQSIITHIVSSEINTMRYLGYANLDQVIDILVDANVSIVLSQQSVWQLFLFGYTPLIDKLLRMAKVNEPIIIRCHEPDVSEFHKRMIHACDKYGIPYEIITQYADTEDYLTFS